MTNSPLRDRLGKFNLSSPPYPDGYESVPEIPGICNYLTHKELAEITGNAGTANLGGSPG